MTAYAHMAPVKELVPDIVAEGIASGWKVTNASTLTGDTRLECDVLVIGTGAGGGITAEMMAKAGLKVLMIEEGPLKTSRDFKMIEAEAYKSLYQEAGSRKTKDKSIGILQGRAVGGTTTVNWTSSFRTPKDTLTHWQRHFGLTDVTEDSMRPWFEQAERRLNVAPWAAEPNANNELLRTGAKKMGIQADVIPRNVKGCMNLGYCGTGCPANAKQSALITTVPGALIAGAQLYHRLRAERFNFKGDTIESLDCVALTEDGLRPNGATVRITAKHVVLAGGSINSPALLLRSNARDPYKRLGKRTFLHPVVLSAAQFDQEIAAYSGAPQSIYSDHYLHSQAIDGPIGYKLEVPPLQPMLFSTIVQGYGAAHAAFMSGLKNTHVQLALLRDGFHDQSVGGTVELNKDGSPVLDYPLNDYVWDGARRALLSMAELQFAAGAKVVMPVHEKGRMVSTLDEARKHISELEMKPIQMRVVSAHVMGGCAMAGVETLGVVQPNGQHWQIKNLSVHDGSVFPTSIGANPQLSIYGQAARMTSGLIERMGGPKGVALA